eukprot:NODE_213_length_12556_cov_0.937063.p1 type:complete len:853 gc:universal NODE_213_length_12556_cov_0.937063:11294-8736(-)
MDSFILTQKLKDNQPITDYQPNLLHLALVLCTQDKFIQMLKQFSDHVNDQDEKGNSLLHLAVMQKKLNIIPHLYNFDIHDALRNVETRLAIDYCDDSVLGITIKQSILNQQNAFQLHVIQQFHSYIQMGQLHQVKQLLTPKCIASFDFNQIYKGQTLLHVCIINHQVPILQHILPFCDPLIRNDQGLLPIDLLKNSTTDKEMAALLKKQMEIVPKLSPQLNTSGVVLKYVNLATGYQPRWLILHNDMIYYKKNKSHNHIRGKFPLINIKCVPDVHDVRKFTISTKRVKWHLKAEYPSEAQKWVLHILHAQKIAKDELASSEISNVKDHNTNEKVEVNDISKITMAISNYQAQVEHYILLLKTNNDSKYAQILSQLESSLKNLIDAYEQRHHYNSSELERERMNHLTPLMPSDSLSRKITEIKDFQDSQNFDAKSSETLQSNPDSDVSSDDEFFDANSHLVAVSGYPAFPRAHLPITHKPIKYSIIKLLKDAIGQDLTRITLPVFFNEPISLLQRTCEEIEYVNLLDQAANVIKSNEGIDSIVYIAAYALSGYASTVGRLGKPFNPLLGETFEYCQNYSFVSEQVSHHPPISACHLSNSVSSDVSWEFAGTIEVLSQFGGTSLNIVPKGWNRIKLQNGSIVKEFTYQKVTTSVNNLLLGKMYIDHTGDMEITEFNSNKKVILHYHGAGWRMQGYMKVTGEFYQNDNLIGTFDGQWNDSMIYHDNLTGKSTTIWKYHNSEQSSADFNLTPFAIKLNELNEELKPFLCPTDCRWRPDQRAMEEGRYDDANLEKQRLEELQRARRKQLEESNGTYSPKWFKLEQNKLTGQMEWTFTGDYWKRREEQDWKECPKLFE